MAYELNMAILAGRLTADPEIRYSDNPEKTAVAKYRLAIARPKEGADFLNVSAFGKNAEFAGEHLHKGSPVLVRGKLQTGNFIGRSGKRIYTTTVIADHQSTDRDGILSFNSVHLEGRLTRDAEYIPGSTAFAKYSLAVARSSLPGQEKQADYINCICFGENAEFAGKYLRKGAAVAVTGRIRTGSYLCKEGVKLQTTEVVVDRLSFAVKKKLQADAETTENTDTAGGRQVPASSGLEEGNAAILREEGFLPRESSEEGRFMVLPAEPEEMSTGDGWLPFY